MNFKNILALCFIVGISMTTVASQPGGKYCGHYDRKLSKRDLHVGFDRRQQHRQAAWEILQAKKAQKVLAHANQRDPLGCYQAATSMPAVDLPTTHVPCSGHFPRSRFRSAYPITTAVLFTVLLMVPCATGLASIIGDDVTSWCLRYKNLIVDGRSEIDKTMKQCQSPEVKALIGEISFPEIPEMWCPPVNPSDLTWKHWYTEDGHANIRKGKNYWDAYVRAAQECNRRIDEHNANLCLKYRDFIEQNRQSYIEIMETAHEYKDLIGEITFPKIPNLKCPSELSGFSVQYFIKTFEKKRQELLKRIEEHNIRLAQEKPKASSWWPW